MVASSMDCFTQVDAITTNDHTPASITQPQNHFGHTTTRSTRPHNHGTTSANQPHDRLDCATTGPLRPRKHMPDSSPQPHRHLATQSHNPLNYTNTKPFQAQIHRHTSTAQQQNHCGCTTCPTLTHNPLHDYYSTEPCRLHSHTPISPAQTRIHLEHTTT